MDKDGSILDVFVNTKEMHAEYGLVKKLKNKNNLSKVIVVRSRRCDDILTNSKPCDNCTKAMKDAGVKSCVFSIHQTRFSVIYY